MDRQHHHNWIIGVGALVILAAEFAWFAWVHDDAYITFRTVDNAVNGFGLRWNPIERVQTYTHPLWMLLHLPVYFLTREAFLTTIAISLVCSVGAAALPILRALDRPWLMLGTLAAPLALASVVVHYATSGLETPLTYLCVAAFAVVLMRADLANPPVAALGLLAGLGMLNRLDSMLLYAPALCWLLVRYRRQGSLRRLLPGAGLLVGWELFSILYYGFPFPNTWYAKQPIDFPRLLFLRAGAVYGYDLLVRRTESAALFVAGLAAAAAVYRRSRRRGEPRDPRLVLLACGAALYGAYTVWIGGDYLSGRFWAAPVFLAILVFHWSLRRLVPPRFDVRVAVACVGVVGVLRLLPPAHRPVIAATGITYVSSYLEGKDLLRNYRPDFNVAQFRLAILARTERDTADAMRAAGVTERHVIRNSMIGLAGYYAGPHVVMVDPLALGDPLLARLPAADMSLWRSGHLVREVPVGYEYAIATGNTSRMAPPIRTYYERLRLITSGPIWDPDRLLTILAFNLGHYDDLRAEYLAPTSAGTRTLADLAEPVSDGTPWNAPPMIRLPTRTRLTVHADPPATGNALDISVEAFGIYEVVFFAGDTELGRVMVHPSPTTVVTQIAYRQTLPLPPEVRGRAIDRITIEPRGGRAQVGGNGQYSLGHLRLQ